MIPASYIQEWSNKAPWPDSRQVEQDLIITRALCDLSNSPTLEGKIAFRGGTVINKLLFFRAHGTGYSVMEYAEGETLSELLQRKGTLTESELKQLLFPILDGLEAVHEADFLHRDIKPGNIVIRDDGSPVLIDFGPAGGGRQESQCDGDCDPFRNDRAFRFNSLGFRLAQDE